MSGTMTGATTQSAVPRGAVSLRFDSAGTECDAWYFEGAKRSPFDVGGRRPVVVMAHVFAGTKDSGLAPFIPLLLCGIINTTVYYLCAAANIVGRFYITLPFTVPGPLQAFLATGDAKTIILWALLFVVDIPIV